MKSKFTILFTMALAILLAGCSKNNFNERDAIAAQKELLNLKYQHEIDLETLKQKGVNALQQLVNSAALEQLKLNDSLVRKSAIAAKKADYSIAVVDVVTNSPLADVDVNVSSEGKIYSAKTNAQGIATFTSLYLFPTSSFFLSKTGYAATQIFQQYIANGPARLWNNTDLTSEISGNLLIDTDLTNTAPEKVGANVLVTASTVIPGVQSQVGSYNVYFPSYTTATGSYSIKLPASISGYSLSFEQIAADQKLYVNATEDDAVTTFPGSLPRIATIKTFFNVNNFNAPVPYVQNSYYFKLAPDKAGKILYMPGYSNGQLYLSATGDKFQLERLINYNYIDVSSYTYDANSKIDVQFVDVTGNLMQTPPQLIVATNANGKAITYNSPEGGSGYVHLKRNDAGAIIAKGVFLKTTSYDSYLNLYILNAVNSLNTTNNRLFSTNNIYLNKGDKKVLNFYYGSGESRVKQVY